MFFIIYAALCVAVYPFAKNRGREPIPWVLTSVVTTPLIAFLILACLTNLKSESEKLQRQAIEQQRHLELLAATRGEPLPEPAPLPPPPKGDEVHRLFYGDNDPNKVWAAICAVVAVVVLLGWLFGQH